MKCSTLAVVRDDSVWWLPVLPCVVRLEQILQKFLILRFLDLFFHNKLHEYYNKYAWYLLSGFFFANLRLCTLYASMVARPNTDIF